MSTHYCLYYHYNPPDAPPCAALPQKFVLCVVPLVLLELFLVVLQAHVSPVFMVLHTVPKSAKMIALVKIINDPIEPEVD